MLSQVGVSQTMGLSNVRVGSIDDHTSGGSNTHNEQKTRTMRKL